MVIKEVESDKNKKQSKDPNWVPRDWVTLRSVVHESWDKQTMCGELGSGKEPYVN